MTAQPTVEQANLTCHQCGEAKPDVYLRNDPFMEDVHGEIETDLWCDECWLERKDAV